MAKQRLRGINEENLLFTTTKTYTFVYLTNQICQILPSKIIDSTSLQLLRIKSKLDAFVGVSVKFTQSISPLKSIFSFLSA